ncbi:MAG TPA: LLM class flavin-dependent oxidoreductase [Stellaceae bacterium]|nr:LLM class flavin-dependent oxidoreductase [Stellaceae bacterium]
MAQLHFAVFMEADSNYHLSGWRLSDTYADTGLSLERWTELAHTMERGKLDMMFIADSHGVAGINDIETLSHSSRVGRFEPFTILSALSSVTTHLGLAATSSTTYNEPYTVARMFASLDHLSGGRAGWNFVTGANREDAFNFGHKDHMPHAQRYDRAEEFADVVRGLWDSFEDDAFLRDKETGRFFDPKKLHVLNHKGKYFTVRGPLSVARPPQGHPVLIQAGKSEPARELSARVADAVFTSQATLEDARAFYADVKGRLKKYGRSPDDVKILPGVAIFTGRTAAEAQAKYERLHALVNPKSALALLTERLGGIDLSGLPFDGPVPEMKGNDVRMSNPTELSALAHRENLTIRQLAYRYAAARSHWMIIGSASEVADRLEEWFVTKAADGFNLLPTTLPGALDDFVDLVVPELQRRGLFRTEYEGRTLRENLGLPRPANRFVAPATPRQATA